MLSILSCAFWPFVCLLGKAIQILCSFFNWIIWVWVFLFFFFCYWAVCVLYIFFNINPLSDKWFANIFSLSSLSFHFIDGFLCWQKVRYNSFVFRLFVCFYFVLFAFVAFAFGVKFKKSSPRPMSKSLLFRFSSTTFMVLGLVFNSLIYFDFLGGVV